MRIAIISDIHSNLQALTQALSIINKSHIETIYCLGDIVGYGANPNECVELIRERASLCVLGNHDLAAIDVSEAEYFARPGRIAAEWTHDVLTEENHLYLASLPYSIAQDSLTLVHASPMNPAEWQYVLTYFAAQQQFAYFSTPVCFIGHTHVPVICSENLETTGFRKGVRFLVNVGSIGQPRDGNPELSFGMLDTASWTYENVRSRYDISGAAQAILQQKLPKSLADRLFNGT